MTIYRLSIRFTAEQRAAIEEAMRRTGHTGIADFVRACVGQAVQTQHLTWPAGPQHGGWRERKNTAQKP